MPESFLSILAVCGTTILSQLSPGPDVFFVFRTSLAQGYKRGLVVAFGITIGAFIQSIVACTLGVYVLEQSWSQWVIYAAAAWLFYLAWKIFPRSHTAANELSANPVQKESILSLLLQGFLCNILNVKCMLFIMSLSADALRSHAALSWYVPALIGSLFAANLFGWCLWSSLLQFPPVRAAYLRHIRLIDEFFALILFVFGLLLLMT